MSLTLRLIGADLTGAERTQHYQTSPIVVLITTDAGDSVLETVALSARAAKHQGGATAEVREVYRTLTIDSGAPTLRIEAFIPESGADFTKSWKYQVADALKSGALGTHLFEGPGAESLDSLIEKTAANLRVNRPGSFVLKASATGALQSNEVAVDIVPGSWPDEEARVVVPTGLDDVIARVARGFGSALAGAGHAASPQQVDAKARECLALAIVEPVIPGYQYSNALMPGIRPAVERDGPLLVRLDVTKLLEILGLDKVSALAPTRRLAMNYLSSILEALAPAHAPRVLLQAAELLVSMWGVADLYRRAPPHAVRFGISGSGQVEIDELLAVLRELQLIAEVEPRTWVVSDAVVIEIGTSSR